MKRNLGRFIVIIILVLALPALIQGELYECVDQDGNFFYTTTPHPKCTPVPPGKKPRETYRPSLAPYKPKRILSCYEECRKTFNPRYHCVEECGGGGDACYEECRKEFYPHSWCADRCLPITQSKCYRECMEQAGRSIMDREEVKRVGLNQYCYGTCIEFRWAD